MIFKKRGIRISLLVLLLLTVLALPASAKSVRERPQLFVGGVPFGVRFLTEGVLVVDYARVAGTLPQNNPAKVAGILPGDALLEVNGKVLSNTADLTEAVGAARGEINLKFKRKGEVKSVTLTPAISATDGKNRLGLLVRDAGAGIGTVTYVKEDGHSFGGLGHGICDSKTGEPIPLSKGSVMDVHINGVIRGEVGKPGELRGRFTADETGSLSQNTNLGVFGTFAATPALPTGTRPLGFREELHEGDATLFCTLEDNLPHEYHCSLSAIHPAARGNKCFTVTITDPQLLEKTGGIVQGMSGSPILQDGKLVGAITHVMVNNPAKGYGIFIENMLETARPAA